jgi:hypothetical protein
MRLTLYDSFLEASWIGLIALLEAGDIDRPVRKSAPEFLAIRVRKGSFSHSETFGPFPYHALPFSPSAIVNDLIKRLGTDSIHQLLAFSN